MKEPDDILKEIRGLLGEDIEKINEEELSTKETEKEESKIPIEPVERIEKLLSEIEKEPESIKEGLEIQDEELVEELEVTEHQSTRAPEHQEIEEETSFFELEEELEKEELPIPIEQELEKEEIEEERTEPENKEETPSFEFEEELEEKEEPISVSEPVEFETYEEKKEKTPFFEIEEKTKEEDKIPNYQLPEVEREKPIKSEIRNQELGEKYQELEEGEIEEEKTGFESLEDKTPNKEQEEMRALLKEDVKKKAASALPKKSIKINKNLVFIPIFILLILGIIGVFGFLYIYPNKELKSAIGKIEKGKLKEGEDMFNKWINFVFLKNQKLPFYHQLGEAYLSINDPHKASFIFWEAFKIDPNNQATHNYIFSSTLKREGWEKAKETAEKILSKDSRSIPAYLILSRYFSKEGEIKKAISYLENGALKAFPSNLSVISLLQILYFQNKQYDKTISLHRFLIDHLKNKPLNPEIVTKASGYFIEEGKLKIGKPPLKEILRAFPKNIEARYLLALSLVKEKNIEKATEELKTVLKNEGYPPAYNLLGEILKDKGKYMDALSAFSSAVFKDPHFGKAHYNLADTAFYNFNDYSTSIKGYEDARKNGYTVAQLSYNLGLAYYLKGKYEKARNEFENLNKDKTVLYNIACADSKLKNFNLAKGEFKEAESLCKERLKEKISPKEEKELYLFLSNIYNNLGLISEISGSLLEAQDRYFDAINTAKLSDFEHKEAFSNLTNLFNGRSNFLSSLSDKMDREYIVQE